LKRLGQTYVPNRAIFAVDPNRAGVALLPEAAVGKKQIAGQITAYVCLELPL